MQNLCFNRLFNGVRETDLCEAVNRPGLVRLAGDQYRKTVAVSCSNSGLGDRKPTGSHYNDVWLLDALQGGLRGQRHLPQEIRPLRQR